jgi:hypothetical protein
MLSKSVGTFGSGTDDRLQHLLVIEDQDKALRGAYSQGCRDIETGWPSKVTLANLREDLTSNLLQLGPPYHFPRCLWSLCLVWLLLEEQIARE